MWNEEQDGGYRPPYVDPLSGVSVTAPASGWTPPPVREEPAGASWMPPPGPGEEQAGEPAAKVTDAELEDALATVVEIFNRASREEQAAQEDAQPAPAAQERPRVDPSAVWTPPAAEQPLVEQPAAQPPAPDPEPVQTPPAGSWTPPAREAGPEREEPRPQADGAAWSAPGGAAGQAPGWTPGAQSFDPTTAAAVAAAMATVFADIGRTQYGVQSQPGPGTPQGGGQFNTSIENVVAAIMSDAGRRTGVQPDAAQERAAEEEMVEIISSVHSWEAAPEPQAEEAEWDPIQAEAARVRATIREDQGAREPERPRAQESAAPPNAEPPEPETQKSAPRRAEQRGERPVYGRAVKARRPRAKLRIARGARAKGMRGGLDLSKTRLNVAIQRKTMASPSRAIPIFLLVLVCIAAFGYFGVYQFMARANQEESVLRALQAEAARLTQATAGFPAVQQEYTLYGKSWMTEEEQAQVDVLEVLALSESELMPRARVQNVTMNQNVLSVTMSGVTLDATALIVSNLEAMDIVEKVSVYTAASLDDQNGVVSPGGYVPEQPEGVQAPVQAQPGAGAAVNTNVTMSITLKDPDYAPPPAPAPEAQGGEEAAG